MAAVALEHLVLALAAMVALARSGLRPLLMVQHPLHHMVLAALLEVLLELEQLQFQVFMALVNLDEGRALVRQESS